MIIKLRNSVVLCGLLFIISGCITTPQIGHEVSSIRADPKNEGITLTGSSSRYIVKNKDGSFCFGPPPDAAFTDSMSGSMGGLALTLFDNSTVNSSSSDALADAHQRVGLGGRNPNVLISREILFESCLLMEKANLTSAQMIDLYKITLDAIVQINAKSLDGNSIKSDNGASESLSLTAGSVSTSSSDSSDSDN
ncbi:hypothetical protein GPUN_1579 [Glaciecola punicea ACAM 611]|jgi:hypothetical protein|uniref:Lipoprotein n=1 Tax=Glaciecola punicea ACAM 611 TaxID=1121923 RepID=H5TBL9_9ALTE|nr:hypothetical protein [Glaciecola punicea]GAB55696.1 hypothetical protein GPUN_1579 [Glaciecola punicea ACAM 611]